MHKARWPVISGALTLSLVTTCSDLCWAALSISVNCVILGTKPRCSVRLLTMTSFNFTLTFSYHPDDCCGGLDKRVWRRCWQVFRPCVWLIAGGVMRQEGDQNDSKNFFFFFLTPRICGATGRKERPSSEMEKTVRGTGFWKSIWSLFWPGRHWRCWVVTKYMNLGFSEAI